MEQEEAVAVEFNEVVSAKLPEWSDQKARLEKKRIQKQKLNQHYREWMKDLVMIHPLEVDMLAEDDIEAAQIRKDHAKYMRKALFDEYTFKKIPLSEEQLEERAHKDKVRKNTENIIQQSKKEENESDSEAANFDSVKYGESFGKEVRSTAEGLGKCTVKAERNHKWFTRAWLMKRGSSSESVCTTSDPERHISATLRRLVKEALEAELQEKVLETVRVLKAGVLFDALYTKVEVMVREIVDNARHHAAESDHKWLDRLMNESPETLTDKMIDELFQEAPIVYFEKKITKRFADELLIPVTEAIHEKYVSADPTIVTTRYKRKEVAKLVKRELPAHKHICTTFKIAEEVAKIIADEVTSVVRFRLDVPEANMESADSEPDLKTIYDNRMEKLREEAEQKAKKRLEHLRSPETARREILKQHVVLNRYSGKEGNCKCMKTSPLGGKKPKFQIPSYKKRLNYYFYHKYISDKNRNAFSTTLYPKNRNNVKLVCDERWECTPVPLERELRDIPYRFSYAPPTVVKQIKATKSLKKEDNKIICNIMKRMANREREVGVDAIMKTIMDRRAKPEMVSSSVYTPLPEQDSSARVGSKTSLPIWGNIRKGSGTSNGSVKGTSDPQSSQKGASLTLSNTITPQTSEASENLQMKPAVISRKARGSSTTASRESQVPASPEIPKYHKYVVGGYKWDMVPITPCRFHSLKQLKTVLKRFETSGGPAALEYHFESRDPPVNVKELLPIPRIVDAYKQYKGDEMKDTSLWTRALNDSRLKRMAQFRKLQHKDPVFGFMSNWESANYKCPL